MPTIAGFMAAVGRQLAGPITPADRMLVLQGGLVKWIPVPLGLTSSIKTKTLVVNATTGLYTLVPSTDFGFRFLAYGIDQQIIELANNTVAPKDFTYGALSFQVHRLANGTVSINPKLGADGAGVTVHNPTALEAVMGGQPLTATVYPAAPNDWYLE
jgi:hypothetical protein